MLQRAERTIDTIKTKILTKEDGTWNRSKGNLLPTKNGTKLDMWSLDRSPAMSRPSHNLSENGRAATSWETSVTNPGLGCEPRSDEKIRTGVNSTIQTSHGDDL